MKRFLLAMLSLFFFGIAFAQYDYFQWAKYSAGLTGVSVSSNSGIAVDKYNRVFFIASNGTVSWEHGSVNSSAPKARSNSNLVYKRFGSTIKLYYIGQNNKLTCLKNDSQSGWTYTQFISNEVANGSSIEVNKENQIYYVNASNNKVYVYYEDGTGGHNAVLRSSGKSAKSWSNIIRVDNAIFYVGGDGKLAGLEYNYATGIHDILSTSSHLIAENSHIQASGKDLVFYIKALDNRVGFFWRNSSSSGHTTLNGTSTPAMVKSPILKAHWNEVNYIGTDGNVHCLYWDNYDYKDYTLNTSCNINSSGGSYFALNEDKETLIYFSNSNFYYLQSLTDPNFVHRRGDKLFLNHTPYTPLIVNYNLRIYSLDDQNFFIGPTTHYYHSSEELGNNAAINENAFAEHLQHIKSMGFTAIRFNGLSVYAKKENSNDPNIYFEYAKWNSSTGKWNHPMETMAITTQTRNKLFELYDKVLAVCAQNDLKVNAFLGMASTAASMAKAHPAYTDYLQKFGQRYANDDRFFCYSITLEADDRNKIHCKTYLKDISEEWYDAIRIYDKKHLITHGLRSPKSVLTWDPAVLKSDFLTFHLYPEIYGPNPNEEKVRRALHWIHRTMKRENKPWIIGETSFGGDKTVTNYTGTYEDQRNYGLFVRNNVFASGGSGLSWWQYKDKRLPGGGAEIPSYYYGLINHDGEVKTIAAPGTNIFKNFTPIVGNTSTVNPADYYHVIDVSPVNFERTGHIQDSYGNDIKDAVIWAIEGWGLNSFLTFSDDEGNFIIRSSHPIAEIHISALNKEVLKIKGPFSTNQFNNVTLGSIGCFTDTTLLPNTPQLVSEERDLELNQPIKLFPNPTTGQFFIQGENLAEIEVYDHIGKRIIAQKNSVGAETIKIELGNHTIGLYTVKCVDHEGKQTLKKLMKGY